MRRHGIHQSEGLMRVIVTITTNHIASFAASIANQDRRVGSFQKKVRPETNVFILVPLQQS